MSQFIYFMFGVFCGLLMYSFTKGHAVANDIMKTGDALRKALTDGELKELIKAGHIIIQKTQENENGSGKEN